MQALLLLLLGLLTGASVDAPPRTSTAPIARPETPGAVRIPKATIVELLEERLAKKDLLNDFQVVHSKFSKGRAVLERVHLEEGRTPGTLRFELHGGLSFKRRQLGVKWRGLKSHKKWFDKGRKTVALVRLTGEVRIGRDERGPYVMLERMRVKLTSRLRPLRGVVGRFDLDSKRVELKEDRLGQRLLGQLKVERVTKDAVWLAPAR